MLLGLLNNTNKSERHLKSQPRPAKFMVHAATSLAWWGMVVEGDAFDASKAIESTKDPTNRRFLSLIKFTRGCPVLPLVGSRPCFQCSKDETVLSCESNSHLSSIQLLSQSSMSPQWHPLRPQAHAPGAPGRSDAPGRKDSTIGCSWPGHSSEQKKRIDVQNVQSQKFKRNIKKHTNCLMFSVFVGEGKN